MNFKVTIDVQNSIDCLNDSGIARIELRRDKTASTKSKPTTVLVEFKDKNKADQKIPLRGFLCNTSCSKNIHAVVKDMENQKISIIKNGSNQVEVKFWDGSNHIFKISSKKHPSFFLNF